MHILWNVGVKPALSPSPQLGVAVLCRLLISVSTVTHSWDPGEAQLCAAGKHCLLPAPPPAPRLHIC